MKPKQSMTAGMILGAAVFLTTGSAMAECEPVRGRIVSEQVEVFSRGEPCPSVLGLCTEGRFSGDLKGRFKFIANSLTLYDTLDPTTTPNVAAVTGVNKLQPRKLCHGTLVFTDTSAFSLEPDGFVGGLETVDGSASTGSCYGASGRIRIEGVFMEGCVDCTYKGEICIDRGQDDDDDDDDNDEDDDKDDD